MRLQTRAVLCVALLPSLSITDASAQQVIRVSKQAWLSLAPSEQEIIKSKYIVDLAELNSFGIIIDNQGVNESTPGTSAGANLGGAIAQAGYVDNSIRTGNYSAKSHLAATFLGAMVGSTLDSQPRAQYHFRYAVKLGDGNIQYFDEIKSDAFRHAVGVCISVPNVVLAEQQLCTQTAALLIATYIDAAPVSSTAQPPYPPPGKASGIPMFIWPAIGKVSSIFSENGKGIDIDLTPGNPVLAAAAGEVLKVSSGLIGYGKFLIIKHNPTYLTVYAHNKNIFVQEGNTVTQGQRIAEAGDTDANSSKFHFEIRQSGKPVNPMEHLPGQKN